MKQIFTYSCAVLLIMFTACSKSPNKILPKKDGVWNFVNEMKVYQNNNFLITDSTIGVMEFKKDGSGFNRTNNGEDPIKWLATKNTVTIIDGSETITYDVVSKGKKSETWQTIKHDTIGSFAFRYEIKVELKKP